MAAGDYQDDPLTHAVIGCAIGVHRSIGPGLLESAYQVCLAHILRKHGHAVRTEVALPVVFDGIQLECGYRMDMVVNDAVVVEVKSVDKLAPIHEAQLLTYLRLSGYGRGLVINFNVPILKDGIVRRALTRSTSFSATSAPLR